MAGKAGKDQAGAKTVPKKPAAEEPVKKSRGKRPGNAAAGAAAKPAKTAKPEEKTKQAKTAKPAPASPGARKQQKAGKPEEKTKQAKPAKPAPAAPEARKQQKVAKPEKSEERKQAKPAKPAQQRKKGKSKRQLTTAEWRRIRLEYVKGKTTYRELAAKWGKSENTIRQRASKEGWTKKKHKLDAKVEQKVLERACDARAREFELIARVNDDLSVVLDGLLQFISNQPPQKYDDLRGVESLSKAIYQVVQTKRDLYNVPSETDRAKIEALREKNRLEREKWETEMAEKAKAAAMVSGTMWQVSLPEGAEAELDG